MNRKARRAARHQEQRVGSAQLWPAAPSGTQQLFEAAYQHQQAGRPAEAAQLYHRILAIDSRHFNSLQNLGAIALGAGRPDMAADLFRRALAINEASGDVQCNLAIALSAIGQQDEAINHCRRALALNPNYVWSHIALGRALWAQGKRNDAVASFQCALLTKPDLADTHAYLGRLLTELNRFEEAHQCFERAIELSPDDAQTHVAFGDLHVAQGDTEGSLNCYVRAMELKPDNIQAHFNFGTALMALRKFDAVTEYYEKFLELQPKFVHGYNLLARAYNSAGNAPKAMEAVRRGLEIEETRQGKSIFVECLSNMGTFGKDLKELIARAVSEPWARPMTLARHCVAVIQSNEEIGPCIARAEAAWPGRLPADQFFGLSSPSAMAHDKLLLIYLENSRVVGLQMEKFVTGLRFALLDKATTAPEADEHTLALCCSLARQCFVSEYAFLYTSEELVQANTLRDSLLTALNANAPVSAFQIAVLAAYVPLHSLAGHERLLAQQWPQPLEDLLTQQVREPAEERRLRATIPAITPIQDGVSVAVRDQYEHNPYPRWVSTRPPELSPSINGFIRTRYPHAEFHQLAAEGPINVLSAGCGTGQTLVDHSRLAGAQTLAVDLSLTSLSYAKRKIEALGMSDIELAQADILELGSLDRKFDVINCGGVLHHLGDPVAGWRVLLSLLKPNGFMSIALYSELARSEYVAAQRLIKERGYGSSPDEIRRFRLDLIAAEDSAMRSGVLDCPDFYSISECRDLLFHVQEHRMTIPQLKTIFEENDLRFIGFDVTSWVQLAYTQRFPDDVGAANLDNWHVFEQENPSTFGAMYAFWVQKGRAAA